MSQGQQFQRLKVEDALSYLDPGQAAVWQPATGVQRLSRHNERVQVADDRHARCHQARVKLISWTPRPRCGFQYVPTAGV